MSTGLCFSPAQPKRKTHVRPAVPLASIPPGSAAMLPKRDMLEENRFTPREAVWFEHSDGEHKTIVISSETDLAGRLMRDESALGHMRVYLEVGPSRWGRLRGKEFGAAGMMKYTQFELRIPSPTHVSQHWLSDSAVATNPVGKDGVLQGTFKGKTTPAVKIGQPFVDVPFAGVFRARRIEPPSDPLLRATIESLATGWRRR